MIRNILGVEGHVGALGWGLGWVTSGSIIHVTCINQTISWLMRNWNTFGHGQTTGKYRHTRFTMAQTRGKPPPSPYSILYAWPWGLHPNVILSRDSQVGSPEILEIGTFATLQAPNFLCKPTIEWGLNQSCSLHREPFNGMSHATCTQVNQGDFRFLVVGNQIGNLIFGSSFGHNLCFKWVMQAQFKHLHSMSFSMV